MTNIRKKDPSFLSSKFSLGGNKSIPKKTIVNNIPYEKRMQEQETRINKYLSQTGICSRRTADQLLIEKRVSIDGRIAVLGDVVFPNQVVTVDGKRVDIQEKLIYIKLYKPKGIETTTDLNVPENIISFINYNERIFPVGRLDKYSSGLIILTNDGRVVNALLRREFAHEREYMVKLNQPFDRTFMEQMSQGIPIDDEFTLPCQIERYGSNTFKLILKEGRNRQIRKMCEHLGYHVSELIRTRILDIHLGDMKIGEYRHLTAKERNSFLRQINVKI